MTVAITLPYCLPGLGRKTVTESLINRFVSNLVRCGYLFSNYTISTGSWHVQVGKKTKTGQPNMRLIDQ